jgi:AmiR/NasT family two-component response regulator
VTRPENGHNGSDMEALVKSLTERNHQLQRALESRIVIEQAKGVLVERLALAPDDAFEILRRAARSQRRRIHDLAAEVVASRDTPALIHAAAAALNNGADARDESAA